MGRCRATKRFRRKDPSGSFMSGVVRCHRQVASHVRSPNVRYSKSRHGGHFNGDAVEWDITPKEQEEYQAQSDELVAEMRLRQEEWEAISVMEKPQGAR